MSYFYAGDLSVMCGENCPLECQSITYTTSASSSIYPSDMFASMMKDNPRIQSLFYGRTNVTPEELRKNILSINVFYTSLSYQSFTEVAKIQISDLVSSIGGTLGLFLGVSFLTFIEIFDLFFYLLLAYHHRSKKIYPNFMARLKRDSLSHPNPPKWNQNTTFTRNQVDTNYAANNREDDDKTSDA